MVVLRDLFVDVDSGLYIVVGSPFLYVPESSMLVMADLHLGFEEAASLGLFHGVRRIRGYYAVFLPRIQLKRIRDMLSRVLGRLSVKRVLINGDVKHVFDRLLRQERDEISELIGFLRERGVEEVVVVRGNHDNYVKPLLEELDVDLVNAMSINTRNKRVFFTHGHELYDIGEYDYVVIGHEHPSIRCFEVYRFPCFLKIPISSGKTLVVMPASGPYHPGVVVTSNPGEYLSPFIRNLDNVDSLSVVTWIDLGEISPRGIEFIESRESPYVRIDRFIVDDHEYAVVEFRDYGILREICRV